MADNKPQITATIKFRGVTIENMTVEELKELRDVINQLVGKDTQYVPYAQPYPVHPVYPAVPTWIYTTTTSSNRIMLDGGSNMTLGLNVSDNVHYTLSCN